MTPLAFPLPGRRVWGLPGRYSLLGPQIIRLAADGLSNREIGQRLCLSHRTVESHLYRVFPKLGVTSRSQLPAILTRLPAQRSG